MAKTIVVGDSVGLGISQALGTMFAGEKSLRIDQMGNHFNSAVAAVEQGDTVIISAGYNSTGPNGISADDVKSLQGVIDQLGAKGAKVVIVPLREEGMTGDYARLNGQTKKTNEQLRGLKGATVAEACIATANGIDSGDIHGAYMDIGRQCVEAASKITAPKATGAGAQTDGEKEAAGADESKSGLEGIWESFKGFVSMIAKLLSGLVEGLVEKFTGLFSSDKESAPTTASATPQAQGKAQAQEEAKTTPDAKTQAAARDAARGSSAAGTGTEVTTASVQVTLPEATGPALRIA